MPKRQSFTMKFATFALFLPVALAYPTVDREGHLVKRQEAVTDQLLFQLSLPQFIARRDAQDPPELDWSSDSCSSSPDNPFGFPFDRKTSFPRPLPWASMGGTLTDGQPPASDMISGTGTTRIRAASPMPISWPSMTTSRPSMSPLRESGVSKQEALGYFQCSVASQLLTRPLQPLLPVLRRGGRLQNPCRCLLCGGPRIRPQKAGWRRVFGIQRRRRCI